MVGAFKGTDGGWTLSNIGQLFHEPYITYYRTSIEVSLLTALLGAILGFVIAYAATMERDSAVGALGLRDLLRRRRELRRHPARVRLHRDARHPRDRHELPARPARHWNIYRNGFTLYSTTGIEIVYLYFQIPLMILVIAPAIDGLRREWREAAANLGASKFQYWRYVGLPILMPVAARRGDPALRQRLRRLRDRVRADLGLDAARADRDRRRTTPATSSRTRTSPRRSRSGCSSCWP